MAGVVSFPVLKCYYFVQFGFGAALVSKLKRKQLLEAQLLYNIDLYLLNKMQ